MIFGRIAPNTWRGAVCCLLLATLFIVAGGAAPATPQKVDEAIKKGVAYLYSKQNKDGNWETIQKRDPSTKPYSTEGGQWGGKTAIVTYALLACDESPQDPRIAKAVEWLRKAELVGTYAVSLRAQVWNNLPKTPENKQAMQRDAKLLLDLAIDKGDNKGFYTYLNIPELNHTYDHSNSQYGVLGSWACAENLEEFPPGYWTFQDRIWRGDQLPSGAWSYNKKPSEKYPEALSMTCAGVATLFITQDFVNRGHPAETNGNPKDPNIDAGMKWIAEHFKDVFDARISRYYALYGIERVGVASGFKYFKDTNWFQSGADYIVSHQGSSGSWSGESDTAFALLFLSRGRAPITMSKLEYEIDGKTANWNQRPRDLANLTKYIGKQTERDLNWQIVNLDAPVEELHDAPILYMAGNQLLKLNDEQKQKLKQFVEQGGMILAQADGGDQKFGKSVRTLGSELFPAYEFRTLGLDHPIFTAEQFRADKFKRKPNVLGLSNGARELMILLPDDPARWWQPMELRRHEEEFQLGADIFLYAIDKQNLRRKGETYLVAPDPKAKKAKTITLARLQYEANWDPEPGGWKRLANIMLNDQKVELKTDIVKLGSGKLKNYKIAHLTGTTQYKLEDAQRKAIKAFIDSGGTLIIDSAGGNAQFAQSTEEELATIFGENAKRLAVAWQADGPVYHAAGAAPEIAWRTFSKATVGNLKGGRLRGLKIKDRIAVIYSPEDLSVGLVGQPIDGINGYEPKTASALMADALLFADKKK
jgi:hypothetical protein